MKKSLKLFSILASFFVAIFLTFAAILLSTSTPVFAREKCNGTFLHTSVQDCVNAGCARCEMHNEGVRYKGYGGVLMPKGDADGEKYPFTGLAGCSGKYIDCRPVGAEYYGFTEKKDAPLVEFKDEKKCKYEFHECYKDTEKSNSGKNFFRVKPRTSGNAVSRDFKKYNMVRCDGTFVYKGNNDDEASKICEKYCNKCTKARAYANSFKGSGGTKSYYKGEHTGNAVSRDLLDCLKEYASCKQPTQGFSFTAGMYIGSNPIRNFTPKSFGKIGFDKNLEECHRKNKTCIVAEGKPAGWFHAASSEIKMVGSASSSDTEEDGFESKCYTIAPTVFGWILCPAFRAAEGTMGALYEWLIAGIGQINPQIFNSDNGIFDAWSVFRNLANILFIIVFLIVIISQLTGYGVDNYGIKKILPKLIVVAILVNISYFIAQLAVDVSNILGASLRKFLIDLAPPVTAHAGVTPLGHAALFLALAGLLVSILVSPGVLMTGFLVLISGLGAVLTLFVMLLVRQVIAVALVIASPIAIVLYALPNTQNISKKFKSIATAILIFSPLAGLVMGAAELTSRILIILSDRAGSDGNFKSLYAIAAVVAGTMPFFLMPSLLRRSMNSIGNIGSTIGRFGSNLTKRSQDGVQKSRAYQGLRTRLNTAGINENGQLNKFGRFRRRLIGASAIATAQEERMKHEQVNNADIVQERMRMNQLQHAATMDPRIRAERLSQESDKLEAESTSAYNTQLLNGDFNISASYQDASGVAHEISAPVRDHTNADQMTKALTAAIVSKNTSAAKAISTIMAQKGMTNQLRSTYESMQPTYGIDMSSTGMNSMRIAIAQSVNNSTVKEENRDIYEWGKNNLTNTANGTMSGYALSSISKLTAESAAKLDAESMERMVNAMQERINRYGSIHDMSDADKENLAKLREIRERFNGHDTSSQRLRDKTKENTRKAIDSIGDMIMPIPPIM